MQTALPERSLGDLRVSVVGLGCNNFGGRLPSPEDGCAVVDAALEAGITLLDTADVYGNRGGSETILGAALRGRREQVVLATKFGLDMYGANGEPAGAPGSRPYIRQAVEASLRRLNTDYIDLYQYHRPDGVTPIDETLGALHELVTEGVVRFIGISQCSAAQLEEANDVAARNGSTAFVSVENEYSLLERTIEVDVLPTCVQLGVGVLPYYPLAKGLLTGKYQRGAAAPPDSRLRNVLDEVEDSTLDRLEALARWADGHGLSPLTVAIGALMAQPAVASVIAGATRPDQVRENVATLQWSPSADELRELDAIFPPGGSYGRPEAG